MGFRVLGLKVWDSGFLGLRFGVQGFLGLKVWDSGFWGLGWRIGQVLEAWDLEFRVGLGCGFSLDPKRTPEPLKALKPRTPLGIP